MTKIGFMLLKSGMEAYLTIYCLMSILACYLPSQDDCQSNQYFPTSIHVPSSLLLSDSLPQTGAEAVELFNIK